MKKIIKILFLILLNSSTVFAQYQYPTAEQLHNFQGGGGIGIPITCSLGEQYFPISPQLRSTVDNFNLAMGVIGISHVGRGLYHFGANLADNTKLALANNESIRAIVTAKFLDWKVSIINLDNLNEAEKILIQEGRIAELRMVDGINSKLTDADFTSLEKQWDGWRILGVNGAGSVFSHVPTSGALITSNAKQGTFLIGSYPTDLQHILTELNYPKINSIDFSFPVPSGQKFNLLNISDDLYQQYLTSGGGFFTQVNGPWIDAAVTQGHDIIVVSNMETLYNSPGVLSGFGKEIHRLEWKHGYRYNPTTKMMVPPSQANGLQTKTLQSEYTHN